MGSVQQITRPLSLGSKSQTCPAAGGYVFPKAEGDTGLNVKCDMKCRMHAERVGRVAHLIKTCAGGFLLQLLRLSCAGAHGDRLNYILF